jgi:hypothetical protein
LVFISLTLPALRYAHSMPCAGPPGQLVQRIADANSLVQRLFAVRQPLSDRLAAICSDSYSAPDKVVRACLQTEGFPADSFVLTPNTWQLVLCAGT